MGSLLWLGAPSWAVAAPGDPDPSFNGSGRETYDPRGQDENFLGDVAIQPDGKILLMGSAGGYHGTDHDVVVLRLNPDGSPDNGFGLGGTASVDFNTTTGHTADDYAGGIAVQSTGKIVVVGLSYTNSGSGEGPSNQHATVARLNQNGSLDTSFGTSNGEDSIGGGRLILAPGRGVSGGTSSSGDSANDVAILPDDRILVVGGTGYSFGPPPTGTFMAMQLTKDGARDGTFGSSGRAFVDFGGGNQANRVALAPNGDAILAGSASDGSTSSPVVARLSDVGSASAGTPVNGFGSGGKRDLSSDIGEGQLNDVAVQSDGKLVLAVTHTTDDATGATTTGVVRLNPDASLDALSGKSLQTIPTGGRNDFAGSVAVDSAGRLLLSAESVDSQNDISFRLARFTPAGALDTTFAHGAGQVNVPLGQSITGHGFGVPQLALQSDGRIVLAGNDYYTSVTNNVFDVRRFLGGSPTLPATTNRQTPTISKLRLKLKRRKLTATFSFHATAASRIQCALMKRKRGKHKPKPKFKPCSSPKTYRHLAPGKYTFEVKAISATGAASLAQHSFKL